MYLSKLLRIVLGQVKQRGLKFLLPYIALNESIIIISTSKDYLTMILAYSSRYP